MTISRARGVAPPARVPRTQVVLIGSLIGASSLFFTAENGQFNTFIEKVMPLELGGTWLLWMVPLMSSFSALMGLVWVIIWGAYSDARPAGKRGRRRPFLLVGGSIAGIAMMFFLLARDFWTCFVLDVLVIGIASNAYVAARASLIPEVTVQEDRGRVNSIASIVSGIFSFGGIILFLLVNESFMNYEDPVNQQGAYLNYTGHVVMLVITGIIIVVASIAGFLGIKERPGQAKDPPPSTRWYLQIQDSFKLSELAKHKEFFKIVLASLVFQTGMRVFVAWVFRFVTELDLPLALMASLLVMFVFVGFGSNYVAGKLSDRIGRKKVLVIVILVASLGFFMVPAIKGVIDSRRDSLGPLDIAAIVLVVSCIILAMNIAPVQDAWAHDLINREKIGQFVGILNVMSTISQMVGVWIGYAILDALGGLEWTLFFAPCFFLASIPLYLRIKDKVVEARAITPHGARHDPDHGLETDPGTIA